MILNDLERDALGRIHMQYFDAYYLDQGLPSRLHMLGLIEARNGVLVLTTRGEDVVRLLQQQITESTFPLGNIVQRAS